MKTCEGKLILPSDDDWYRYDNQDKSDQQEGRKKPGVPGLAPTLQRRFTGVADHVVIHVEESHVRDDAD